MADYTVPGALVYQELVGSSQVQPAEHPACIIGPLARLIRYTEPSEQSDGLLGAVDHTQDVLYPWPNRDAGASVDDTYTALNVKDALLLYFSDPIATGDTIRAASPNKITATSTVFRSNGYSYPAAGLGVDRDVQIGDVARITGVVSGSQYTLVSPIIGFIADTVAGVVGSATSDATNQTSTTATTSHNKTGGVSTGVDVGTMVGTAYDGLITADISETYTVTCIQSSTGQDATTARLQVISASGNDDILSVTPAAFASATAIGGRGLTATWTNTGSGTKDFAAGQVWTLTVQQAFTPPVSTAGGSYNRTADTSYIVTVAKGGKYANDPTITVTTSTGVDISGPTVVSAAAVAVAIGTAGATIKFSGAGLCQGDRYYVPCTKQHTGNYHTLLLSDSFPAGLSGTQVSLELFAKRDIEICKNRVGQAPLVNWSQSISGFTIKSSIPVYQDDFTLNGSPFPLALVGISGYSYSLAYLTARYWLADGCDQLSQISKVADLANIAGPLHPDNPLKYGVYKALQGCSGEDACPVSYVSVCDPDDTQEWLKSLDAISNDSRACELVPLTRNLTVWAIMQAHVLAQSTPQMAHPRRLWLNSDEHLVQAMVNAQHSTNGQVVLATLTHDPALGSGPSVYLAVPANNAEFLSTGVRPGDVVRYIYEGDGFGGEAYTELIVDHVTSENSLFVVSNSLPAATVARRVEIWRNLSQAEQAQEYAKTAGYSDRRVRYIWPPTCVQEGLTVPGYFMCCGLAGLASSVVPHQGLTNVAVNGISSVPEYRKFSAENLDVMAAGGVWIIAESPQSGAIYNRHAITTAEYTDIARREEMVTRNLDSIAYYMHSLFDSYIGVTNATEATVTHLRTTTVANLRYLVGRYETPRLGGQLVAGELTNIGIHPTLRDRLVVDVDVTLPYPTNNIDTHLSLLI